MQQIIVITGASSGFGALAARALAHAGRRRCKYCGRCHRRGDRHALRQLSVPRSRRPIVNGVADRVRSAMFRRIGLEDLLQPKVNI